MVAPPLLHVPLACGLEDQHRGGTAVIGNMDGVHRGHQALIAKARETAAATGATLKAIIFDPHPRAVFAPDAPPFLLTPISTRAQIMADHGVASTLVLPFNEALRGMTPEAFVRDVLVGALGLHGLFFGEDFRFGAGRSGDAEALLRLAADHGLEAVAIAPVGASEEKYASSAIRAALKAGDPQSAAEMLGRPWSISGEVILGRQLAREIGFPTANIALGNYLRPCFGVYAVTATINGEDGPQSQPMAGIANIGVRPTVDGTTERLEVHLFDRTLDLYGKTLSVAFRHFIRPEQPFTGIEALKAQIQEDVVVARAALEATSA